MKPSKKRTSPSPPDLAPKLLPTQQRATDTYEHILAVAAEMLSDIGIERLSTNLICERAGITPPALYRYFPNKYALLTELGRRLMLRQNEIIPRWIKPEVLSGTGEELANALQGLVLDTYRVTKETPGGVWILRALRAVPALRDIRLDSHAEVNEAQGQLLIATFPDAPVEDLLLTARIGIDMIYASVELLFDVDLDAAKTAEIVAAMIASHLPRLRAYQSA